MRPRGRGYPLSARQSVRTNGALRATLCATVGADERRAAGSSLRDSRSDLGPSARQIARADVAALRLCRPAASIRVAPGVAPVAARQQTRRGRLRSNVRRTYPFPSAECASASEKAEATGDPFAPPVRLSAPAGHGRLAPPLREASASPNGTASRGTHGRSRGQGGRGKRRAEPRRVFRGPTGRATRRFTSVVQGGSEGRTPGSPQGWPVGGRPRKTSERTAARSAPFVHTDCRAESCPQRAVRPHRLSRRERQLGLIEISPSLIERNGSERNRFVRMA